MGEVGEMNARQFTSILFLCLLVLIMAGEVPAQEVSGGSSLFEINLAGEVPAQEVSGGSSLFEINLGGEGSPKLSMAIQILILLTLLSLAPALFIMVTCFIRVVVVLSFLRHALGIQQSPPNQVIISLALFLTLFIMTPVWNRINSEALQPYLNQTITQSEALDRVTIPVRKFMLKQVREKDLSLFVEIAKLPKPEDPSGIPTHVVIPAFMISELRTAFQIGFLIYLPFLIVDLVVASILMSVGMMMLPPIMISLPFKLILFVLSDGWYLIVGSLVKSFG